MTGINYLRPHFERMTEEWWETTKLAYSLYPALVTLDHQTVKSALEKLLGGRPNVQVQVEGLDLEYRAYDQDTFKRVIEDDPTNRTMAWKELYDCDDFAWQFKARMRWFYNVSAVGFVLDKSSWHVYNVIVFPDGEAILFEPQQDRFVNLNEPITLASGIELPPGSTGRYSLTSGLILI